MKKLIFSMIAAFTIVTAQAQEKDAKAHLRDWQHQNFDKDAIPGMNTEKAYELLKGRKSQTVLVSVIDSGIEVDHEDLKSVIWTNQGEIAGNGIDDDRNGYIDDIHGWNFIGNSKGEDISAENLEVTRVYALLGKRFKGMAEADVKKKDLADYKTYLKAKDIVSEKLESANKRLAQYSGMKTSFLTALEGLKSKLGTKEFTADNIASIQTTDETEGRMKMMLVQGLTMAPGEVKNFDDAKKQISGQFDGAIKYFKGQTEHHYNTEFSGRAIIKDDYENVKDNKYGNNHYEGPGANHGTHVAGIIGGDRTNGIGMNGVADDVKIMSVRAIPDGDEHDKDVANAIYYSVKNGAKVINMSFGKAFSPYKKDVDKALKYAAKKGVILVHAAGNDGKELTLENNFPHNTNACGKEVASTWIQVGAQNYKFDADLPASFSNYNQETVDVFAPGVDIYSSVTDNSYDYYPGTSMASPQVAGAAALIMSYFPELSAQEVKAVLLDSARVVDMEVNQPAKGDSVSEKVNFKTLSKTGGIIDLEAAVKLAIERTK